MVSQDPDSTESAPHRFWLAAIVAAAFLLRVFALWRELRIRPEPYVEPDGYAGQALLFVAQSTWSHPYFEIFRYGPIFKAPLYPLFLTLFTGFHDFHWAAAIAQIVLNTIAVVALYVLGRDMHSRTAGLIAAAVYACWLPSLGFVTYFLQEQLHVPLVIIGLALLVNAGVRQRSLWRFAAAGVVLALAALARSMPLYYLGPAAAAYVLMSIDRRAATKQMAALVVAFIIVIAPWCVYASVTARQLVLIDNMGSANLGMTYHEVRPNLHTAPPATPLESIGMLVRAATLHPVQFFGDRVSDFRRLFRMVGGQWLDAQPPVETRPRAIALTLVAHSSDVLLAVSAILAPLGVVLARRRREVSLIALWVVLHLGLLVAFAWNGVRYRQPYEPEMIALGAVVLAGGWVRPRWPAVALGGICAAVMAITLAGSIPETAAAHARYGYDQWQPAEGHRYAVDIRGAAGLVLPSVNDALDVTLEPPDGVNAAGPIRVIVLCDGHEADDLTVDGRIRDLRYPWRRRSAYVELRATYARTGEPAALRVIVPRRS